MEERQPRTMRIEGRHDMGIKAGMKLVTEEVYDSIMNVGQVTFEVLHKLHVVHAALISYDEGSIREEDKDLTVRGCEFLLREAIDELVKLTGDN